MKGVSMKAKDSNIKWPPEGKPIQVSLKESNGEHAIYDCIYLGMGIFKFFQNGKKYGCKISEETLIAESVKNGLVVQNELKKETVYLLDKEVLGWWEIKTKEDQNEV